MNEEIEAVPRHRSGDAQPQEMEGMLGGKENNQGPEEEYGQRNDLDTKLSKVLDLIGSNFKEEDINSLIIVGSELLKLAMEAKRGMLVENHHLEDVEEG